MQEQKNAGAKRRQEQKSKGKTKNQELGPNPTPQKLFHQLSYGVFKTHHQTTTAPFETTRLELLRPGV